MLKCHGLSVLWQTHLCNSQKPVNHETLSIAHHVEIPVGLFIHSSFLGPLHTQALVDSEVGRSRQFPPMRDSRFQWSRALDL